MNNENFKLLKPLNNNVTPLYIEDNKLIYDPYSYMLEQLTNLKTNLERTRTYYELIVVENNNIYIKGRPYLITFPYTTDYSIEKALSISDIDTPGVREVFVGDKGTLAALDNVTYIQYSTQYLKYNASDRLIAYVPHQMIQYFVNKFNQYNNIILNEFDINNESTNNWPVKNITYTSGSNLTSEEGMKKLAKEIQEDDKKTQIIREFIKNVVTSQYDIEDYKEFTKDIF